MTFELGYEPWDADGVTLSEVKRVTLDAGHHMNRFESRYTIHGKPRELQHAAGVKRSPATAAAVRRDLGVLRTWEAFRDDNGHLGCAVVMDPSVIVDVPEPNANHLFVARVDPKGTAVYHAGSAWDRGGDIADVAAWDRYLDAFARRSRAPVEVEVASGVSP